MPKTWVVGSAVAFMLWGSSVQAQPVTSFAEVAGKWSGVGSRGAKVDIAIENDGKFVIDVSGRQAPGIAKLDGGVLVLAYANNQGQIRFTRTGDVMEGPYVAGNVTGTTRVTLVGK